MACALHSTWQWYVQLAEGVPALISQSNQLWSIFLFTVLSQDTVE